MTSCASWVRTRFLCALCVSVAILAFASVCAAQSEKPEWCKALPRPEYKSLQRVLPEETWFEVYKVAPGTFAIYEPHQFEETISYLIVGTKQALLFDTGMGIGNIKAVVARLTSRPIVVLNSHTHNDHVGGNWQFQYIFGMDTAFTRANAKGSPVADNDDAAGPDSSVNFKPDEDGDYTVLVRDHLDPGALAVSRAQASSCRSRLRNVKSGRIGSRPWLG